MQLLISSLMQGILLFPYYVHWCYTCLHSEFSLTEWRKVSCKHWCVSQFVQQSHSMHTAHTYTCKKCLVQSLKTQGIIWKSHFWLCNLVLDHCPTSLNIEEVCCSCEIQCKIQPPKLWWIQNHHMDCQYSHVPTKSCVQLPNCTQRGIVNNLVQLILIPPKVWYVLLSPKNTKTNMLGT